MACFDYLPVWSLDWGYDWKYEMGWIESEEKQK